jgi:hypothetical protein
LYAGVEGKDLFLDVPNYPPGGVTVLQQDGVVIIDEIECKLTDLIKVHVCLNVLLMRKPPFCMNVSVIIIALM